MPLMESVFIAVRGAGEPASEARDAMHSLVLGRIACPCVRIGRESGFDARHV